MRGLRNVGAPRLTWILLGLMSVAAAAVVVILGLRLSFFNDEWYVLLQRPGLSADAIFEPSNEHLIATLIVQKTGANLMHVPYKGGGPAMADAMAGHIPIGMASVAGGMALVKSGKLRPIVVSSAERWPSLPDVPTVVESGVPDVVVMSWIGLIGPAKIPRPVVDRLNAELNASLNTPEMKEKMFALGVRVTPGPPEAFQSEIKKDYDRFGPVIKAAGITVEQ